VRVNADGQLGTATAASARGIEAGSGNGIGRLNAHVRRQDKEIATLTR